MSTCWSSAAASPGSPPRAPPARAGARVLLVEQAAALGRPGAGRRRRRSTARPRPTGSRRRWPRSTPCRTSTLPRPDHGAPASTTTATCWPRSGWRGDAGPRERLWRIRARRIVTATGAIERPLAFAGNDLPGVMLAAAVRDYLGALGVSPGDRTVVVTNNDDAYRTALALRAAGLEVPAVLDARAEAGGALPAGRARRWASASPTGRGIAAVTGGAARHRRRGLRPGRRGRGAARRSPATPSPCPAAGRRSCISGRTAAASSPGTRRRRISRPTRRGRRAARDGAGFVLPAGRGRRRARRRRPASRTRIAPGARRPRRSGCAPATRAAPARRGAGGGAGRAGLDRCRRAPAPALRGEGVPRLPERREGLGRRARRAGGLRQRRARQALHDARHGDRPGQALERQRPRGAGRRARPADPGGRHHHLPPALHAGDASARWPARRAGRCSSRRARRRSTPGTPRTARTGSRSATGGGPTATAAPARASRQAVTPRGAEHRARTSACSTPRRSARSWSRARTPAASSTSSTPA